MRCSFCGRDPFVRMRAGGNHVAGLSHICIARQCHQRQLVGFLLTGLGWHPVLQTWKNGVRLIMSVLP